jgi:hypothetical protein
MILTISRRAVTLGGGALLSQVGGVVAAAGPDDMNAPFGLTWGMSSYEVRKTGVKLASDKGVSDYGTSFIATELSKVLTDTEGVMLFFGYNDKLWRIATFGRPSGPDGAGNEVTSRYLDLAASLSGRYGKGADTDERDTQVYKRPDEYIMSLQQGRARRYTEFHTGAVDVELSIRVIDMNTSHYLIFFEYVPGRRDFEKEKKAHEKDAL